MPGGAGLGLPAFVVAGALGLGGGGPQPTPTPAPRRWCDELPRPAHRKLECLSASDDWFQVYRVGDGVFAICEPFQFQEVISYLILGAKGALLFDTGLGIGKIRPVVERLTPLPVTVINSHTHFDHVGGNADFERILAMDTAYTRANARGFSHEVLAGEVAPEALCRPLPAGADAQNLSDPRLHALRVHPGWPPDRPGQPGGDRFCTCPDTRPTPSPCGTRPPGFSGRETRSTRGRSGSSCRRRTGLPTRPRSTGWRVSCPRLKKLFPAHNVAVSDPGNLLALQEAVRAVRSGKAAGKTKPDGAIEFSFGGFSIITSRQALDGQKSAPTRGGSGLPDSHPSGD